MKKEIRRLIAIILVYGILLDLFVQILTGFNYTCGTKPADLYGMKEEGQVYISDNGMGLYLDPEEAAYVMEGYQRISYLPNPFYLLSFFGHTGVFSQQISNSTYSLEMRERGMIFTRKRFEVIPLAYSRLPGQAKKEAQAQELFRQRLNELMSKKEN